MPDRPALPPEPSCQDHYAGMLASARAKYDEEVKYTATLRAEWLAAPPERKDEARDFYDRARELESRARTAIDEVVGFEQQCDALRSAAELAEATPRRRSAPPIDETEPGPTHVTCLTTAAGITTCN